jgi:hypothetical protein
VPKRRETTDDALFGAKPRKAVPYPFVLEAVDALMPETRPFFGCLAVYVGNKIVLILREKHDETGGDGVWLATTAEHHESLRREFPNMRSIGLLGRDITHWQILPAEAPDFEEAALRACELIVAGDPRIGKVPKSRRASGAAGKKTAKRARRNKLSD